MTGPQHRPTLTREVVPSRLIDRWRSRPEPPPGDGLVYWHVLIDQAPQIRERVTDLQKALVPFPALHLPPPRWLHLTLMTVAPPRQLQPCAAALLHEAAERLAPLRPVPVEAEQVLFHPEAVVLRVRPARALETVASALADATTATLLGWSADGHRARPWIPHVTVAYSTADQPAAPIVTAVGRTVPLARGTVTAVSLIEQWGPERAWDWRLAGTVTLGGPSADEPPVGS